MTELSEPLTPEEKGILSEMVKDRFTPEEREAVRNLIDITEKYNNALWLLNCLAKIGKWFIIISGAITAYIHLPPLARGG